MLSRRIRPQAPAYETRMVVDQRTGDPVVRRVRAAPAAPSPKAIPEWRLQAAAVGELRRWLDRVAPKVPFAVAGDMNAGRRSLREAGIAKATGMAPGEPDLRIYLPGGRLGLIEMKGAKTPVSPAQKDRHAVLAGLGHDVAIVRVATEEAARDAVVRQVVAWLFAIDAANDNEPAGDNEVAA